MQNRRYNAAMRVGSRIGRGSGKQLEPGYEVFLNYTYNTAGAHSVTASYGGDALNATSVSMPVAETVTIATSTMVIAANQSPPGKAFTLTATVSGALPTGTVTFMSGTTVLGTATVAAGKATLQYTFAGAGPYSLSASYSGDANNTACVSPTITVTPSTAQTYYIHTDQLDTPRTITDTAGNKVWEWQNLDPFGNNVPNENPSGLGTFVLNLRLPGQYYDAESNLNYNINRDYDPATGRYIQSDPIGLGGGINTYSYAGGDPLSRVDPLGLKCNGTGCWTTPDERNFLNNGDYLGYYATACAGGDRYACYAQRIAANDPVEGWLATFRVSHALKSYASEHHQCSIGSDVLNRIRIDLANAYADYLPSSENHARFPVATDVAKFHWDEFAKFGLPPETFGGTPFGGSTWFSWRWCPNCR